jgi:hypothetical protein
MALFGAWTRPVWHDELYTLALARLALPDLFEALRMDSGPPLHYLICRGLFAILGWPEGSQLGTVAVRLPSVAAFAAMPWIMWLWARQRPIARLLGPLLTVVWLPMLYFATEARVYAVLALVNGTLWLLGPRLVAAGVAGLAVFAALAAALPLLHYTGTVSLLLLALLFFFVPTDRRRPFALAYAAALVPLALWSPIMLAAPEQSMAWVNTMSGPGRPGVASLQAMSPAGPFPALFEGPILSPPPVLSIVAAILLVAGAAWGAIISKTRLVDRIEDRHTTQWLILGLLPTLILGLLSLAGLPVYFAGRSESMILLLGAALVAGTLEALGRPKRVVCAAPYVLVGAATSVLWLVELPDRRPPIGIEIGRELVRVSAAGDLVVVAGLWQLEVEHGLAEGGIAAGSELSGLPPVRTFPESQSDHPGWLDVEAFASPKLLDQAVQLESDARAGGHRVWLVWSPGISMDSSFFVAFADWRRRRVVAEAVVNVDLLVISEQRMINQKPS